MDEEVGIAQSHEGYAKHCTLKVLLQVLSSLMFLLANDRVNGDGSNGTATEYMQLESSEYAISTDSWGFFGTPSMHGDPFEDDGTQHSHVKWAFDDGNVECDGAEACDHAVIFSSDRLTKPKMPTAHFEGQITYAIIHLSLDVDVHKARTALMLYHPYSHGVVNED